eukprot:8909254-Lingulodinium_polyedra.AAC.1
MRRGLAAAANGWQQQQQTRPNWRMHSRISSLKAAIFTGERGRLRRPPPRLPGAAPTRSAPSKLQQP